MTAERRRFEFVAPEWGQTHLVPDAVVAFVDDELSAGAHARAARHIAACPECAGEVAAQTQARSMLRSAHMPSLSQSLLSSLRAIPLDAELPEPPAGLAVGADGSLVQVLRPLPSAGRRWFGAGIAMSGLAVGAALLTVSLLPADPPAVGENAADTRLRVEPASVRPAADPEAVAPAGGAVANSDAVLRILDSFPPVCPPRAR